MNEQVEGVARTHIGDAEVTGPSMAARAGSHMGKPVTRMSPHPGLETGEE